MKSIKIKKQNLIKNSKKKYNIIGGAYGININSEEYFNFTRGVDINHLNSSINNLQYNGRLYIDLNERYIDNCFSTIIKFYSLMGIKKVLFSNKIDNIPTYIFCNNKYLSEVDLSRCENLIHIRKNSFFKCQQLTEIVIPSSVESIGMAAFGECYNLRNIIIQNDGTKGLSINKKAFYGCLSLKNIEISPNARIDVVGDNAFGLCRSIGKIELKTHNPIRSIGENVFSGCKNLKELILPSITNGIDVSAFENCFNLNVTMPDMPLSKIQKLEGCKAKINFFIPVSVTDLNGNNFDFELVLTPKLLRDSFLNTSKISKLFRSKINIKKQLREAHPNLHAESFDLICNNINLKTIDGLTRFLRGENNVIVILYKE